MQKNEGNYCSIRKHLISYRATIEDIIKDCQMIPDARPTLENYELLNRDEFYLWNMKVYNKTTVFLDYNRYSSLQDLANGFFFNKIFNFSSPGTATKGYSTYKCTRQNT